MFARRANIWKIKKGKYRMHSINHKAIDHIVRAVCATERLVARRPDVIAAVSLDMINSVTKIAQAEGPCHHSVSEK